MYGVHAETAGQNVRAITAMHFEADLDVNLEEMNGATVKKQGEEGRMTQ